MQPKAGVLFANGAQIPIMQPCGVAAIPMKEVARRHNTKQTRIDFLIKNFGRCGAIDAYSDL
jgi:hypothetical protein